MVLLVRFINFCKIIKIMIIVLRLSHRPKRDKRISTHVALLSRAFNANKIVYSGEIDDKFEKTVKKVVSRFGGRFSISYVEKPLKFLINKKKNGYKIINLTMYGLRLKDEIKDLRKIKNLIVIVGSEKVEIEYYKISDYNISVTNQPHSEVSSLAILLYEYFNRKLNENFKNAKIRIMPSERGKRTKQ